MVLHLIGLGLGDPKDITIRGYETIKSCDILYLFASNYQPFDKKLLEKFLEVGLLILTIEDIEERIKEIVTKGISKVVGLLMPGDPFCDDLYPLINLECINLKVQLKVVHNASLLNAIAFSGVQLYKFGETILMDTCAEDYLRKYIQTIISNLKIKLHTFILFSQEKRSLLFTHLATELNSLKPDLKEHFDSSGTVIYTRIRDNQRKIDQCLFRDILTIDPDEIETILICSDLESFEQEAVQAVLDYYKSYEGDATTYLERPNHFFLVGLGLGEPKDVTIRGKEIIKNCKNVYLEGYTSIMEGGKEALESYFQTQIVLADREMVEEFAENILSKLPEGNVAFLVVGDPLGATTHNDIVVRSVKQASFVTSINNASIINSAGICGLKMSQFGGITSIPYWEGSWQPESFYDKIVNYRRNGLHTLCLLDIKVKEQSFENLARGRKIYGPPRFMNVAEAVEQLMKVNQNRVDSGEEAAFSEDDEVICLSRVGTATEKIKVSTLGEVPNLDMGGPLHSLIIIGKTDPIEKKLLEHFKL